MHDSRLAFSSGSRTSCGCGRTSTHGLPPSSSLGHCCIGLPIQQPGLPPTLRMRPPRCLCPVAGRISICLCLVGSVRFRRNSVSCPGVRFWREHPRTGHFAMYEQRSWLVISLRFIEKYGRNRGACLSRELSSTLQEVEFRLTIIVHTRDVLVCVDGKYSLYLCMYIHA